jgi:acetylornithine aminotransferase
LPSYQKKNNAVLIADSTIRFWAEVATTFFGFQHHNIEPDIIRVLLKEWGNGFPVGGVHLIHESI